MVHTIRVMLNFTMGVDEMQISVFFWQFLVADFACLCRESVEAVLGFHVSNEFTYIERGNGTAVTMDHLVAIKVHQYSTASNAISASVHWAFISKLGFLLDL
jgi:hypothetical protein